MKQVLQPDHIPRNNYTLRALGIPRMTILEMSGIEEEIDNVELPDRTFASGGYSKPFEFTFSIPAHHTLEVNGLKRWYADCQAPVMPNYKKSASLTLGSISGLKAQVYIVEGMHLCKWKISDMAMDNEGEEQRIEFTAKGDKLRLMNP